MPPPYTFTMQVYVELAIAENFCMDFTLLACSKFITKISAHTAA